MSVLKPFLFALVTAAVLVSTAYGQGHSEPYESGGEESEFEELETDRDSFTPTTRTVGDGWLVLEAAHSFFDNRGVAETHSFPELLARYGVGDSIELRLGWNYEVGGTASPGSGNVPSHFGGAAELERESCIFYGMKAWLTEQQGWCPESSVILQGFTPTSGEATDTEVLATYIFGWTSDEGVTWDSALRYSTSSYEGDDFNVFAPSTVVKVPLGEHWKVHAEYFGIFSDGREEETQQHFFSPGAHYLITPDLEIGARVGWGLNDEAPNFFSNVGMGLRF